MGFRTLCASLTGLALLSASGIAYAQAAAPAVAGIVDALDGAVIVVRGVETYSLKVGDQLFPGDRVLTRTGAGVTIRTPTCSKVLQASQSIVVDADVCTKAAIALGPNEYNVAAGTKGGIGATPALLALLAAGGAGAAAGGGGSSASP